MPILKAECFTLEVIRYGKTVIDKNSPGAVPGDIEAK
jgi:hypothetical protein